MIKVNGLDINYQKAIYAYAQNDSINPTGLGSCGIFFAYDDLEVYIGIKNDVIDVITNKNSNFFVNLEDGVIKQSESLNDKSKFGDGVIQKYYINQIEIEVDVALLRYCIYHKDAQAYSDLFIQQVAKDSLLPGALLRIETPFELGIDGLFIGYIYTKDKELLTLDKAIIKTDELKDDVRFNIWKIKQNIVPHSLRRNSSVMLFEPAKSYQKNGYADYFNNQYSVCSVTHPNRDEINFVPEHSKHIYSDAAMGVTRKAAQANLDYDIFVSHSTVIGPGVVKGQNMTNFGLKEARKGYFELNKGKTWLNIGYISSNVARGDNFYICTQPAHIVEPLSKFELPLRTSVSFGELIPELAAKKIPAYQTLYGKLRSAIWEILPTSNAQAVKILEDIIKESDISEEVKEYSLKRISVSLSVVYYDIVLGLTPQENTTLIFTHPFYETAFATHIDKDNLGMFTNGIYASPVSMHQFGIADKFYYKGMDKEYRNYEIVQLPKNRLIYKDLIWYHSKSFFKGDSMEVSITSLESEFGNYAYMFCIDTQKLADEMKGSRSSNDNYPLGCQNNYVKVHND